MADQAKDQAPDNGDGQAPEVEAVDDPSVEASETTDSPAPAEAEASETTDSPAPAEAEASETTDSSTAPKGEAPAAGRAGTSEPAEKISPKERRRRMRSRHAGEAQPARSPQERHTERLLRRRAKAVRRRARRLKERAKAADRSETAQGSAAPAREPLAPVHAAVEGQRRVRQGIVISDKAEKTITVRIDVARRHRRYEKIVRGSSTLHAHDENNDAHVGDVVRVIESKPLSRTKRWKLVDVLERAR
jgi:small subunit ribosomal protein S17